MTSSLRTAIAAAIGTLAVISVVGALVLLSGMVDVSAFPVRVTWIDGALSVASRRSVDHHAGGEVKVAPAADSILMGASHYGEMCVTCHGAPGVDPDEIGEGLNPRPPKLDRAAKAWSEAQLFWIVKHGVRMTGMPGFGGTHTDEQVADIVAFVRLLPTMSPARYRQLTDSAKKMMP